MRGMHELINAIIGCILNEFLILNKKLPASRPVLGWWFQVDQWFNRTSDQRLTPTSRPTHSPLQCNLFPFPPPLPQVPAHFFSSSSLPRSPWLLCVLFSETLSHSGHAARLIGLYRLRPKHTHTHASNRRPLCCMFPPTTAYLRYLVALQSKPNV